jgi:hypothetical protein
MADVKRSPDLEIGAENNDQALGPSRNPAQMDSDIHEIVFWDTNNPRCVVNMLSEKLRNMALQLPPDLLSCSIKELRRKVDPSYVDEQLRIAFWDEYFVTVDSGSYKLRNEAIYGRVCSRETFYQVVGTPLRFAYMLRPPENYMYQMRALLDIGLVRFKEILELPLENPNGTVNTKLIGELIKLVSLVDNRVKGAVTQKIQIDGTQKNLNVNINQAVKYEPPKSHQEIQAELRQIERDIKSLQAPNQDLGLFEPERVEVVDGEELERELITVEASRVEAQAEAATRNQES